MRKLILALILSFIAAAIIFDYFFRRREEA